MKPKQSPPDKGKLGKYTTDMLKDSPFDPVKLIGDLIQCQRVAIKSQSIKSGGK